MGFKILKKGQPAPLERDVVVEEESPPNYSTATGEEVNIYRWDEGDQALFIQSTQKRQS